VEHAVGCLEHGQWPTSSSAVNGASGQRSRMRSAMCAPEIGSSIPHTNDSGTSVVSSAPTLRRFAALGHVEHQPVQDVAAVGQLAPDVAAILGCVVVRSEGRAQRFKPLLFGELNDEPRALFGIKQRRLDRLRTVQVGVKPSVAEVHSLKRHVESSLCAAREQFLGNGRGVVVRDEHRRPHALVPPQRLNQIRLFE
jgi:hypothetical protein